MNNRNAIEIAVVRHQGNDEDLRPLWEQLTRWGGRDTHPFTGAIPSARAFPNLVDTIRRLGSQRLDGERTAHGFGRFNSESGTYSTEIEVVEVPLGAIWRKVDTGYRREEVQLFNQADWKLADSDRELVLRRLCRPKHELPVALAVAAAEAGLEGGLNDLRENAAFVTLFRGLAEKLDNGKYCFDLRKDTVMNFVLAAVKAGEHYRVVTDKHGHEWVDVIDLSKLDLPNGSYRGWEKASIKTPKPEEWADQSPMA